MNKKKKGLSTTEAQEKLKQYGYNELTEKEKEEYYHCIFIAV